MCGSEGLPGVSSLSAGRETGPVISYRSYNTPTVMSGCITAFLEVTTGAC